MGNDNLI